MVTRILFSVQENFDLLTSFIQDSADKHIPSKTSRSVSSIPWITPEIRRKVRRKNKTHAKAKKGVDVLIGVKSGWAPVLSGVPQGTVLGPLLFSLYINDISSDIESEIRLFADDCVCCREITDEEDTMKLQRDIDRLGCWARKWVMRFQPVKCNMMTLRRKRIKKIHASYTLEGTDFGNVESIKYLGLIITNDLRWNTHESSVCTNLTKANRTLGFLRRNLYSSPQKVKEAAYKELVRPVLDYGSSVWDPQM